MRSVDHGLERGGSQLPRQDFSDLLNEIRSSHTHEVREELIAPVLDRHSHNLPAVASREYPIRVFADRNSATASPTEIGVAESKSVSGSNSSAWYALPSRLYESVPCQ